MSPDARPPMSEVMTQVSTLYLHHSPAVTDDMAADEGHAAGVG